VSNLLGGSSSLFGRRRPLLVSFDPPDIDLRCGRFMGSTGTTT